MVELVDKDIVIVITIPYVQKLDERLSMLSRYIEDIKMP